jgi:hypothetical protein
MRAFEIDVVLVEELARYGNAGVLPFNDEDFHASRYSVARNLKAVGKL